MEQKVGIENLKRVVKGIATIANVGDAFGREKGTNRWQQLIGLGELLRQLNGIDFRKVVGEIKDLDKPERDELRTMFDSSFDLRDDQLEDVVEEGLGLLEDIASVVDRTQELIKQAKA